MLLYLYSYLILYKWSVLMWHVFNVITLFYLKWSVINLTCSCCRCVWLSNNCCQCWDGSCGTNHLPSWRHVVSEFRPREKLWHEALQHFRPCQQPLHGGRRDVHSPERADWKTCRYTSFHPYTEMFVHGLILKIIETELVCSLKVVSGVVGIISCVLFLVALPRH